MSLELSKGLLRLKFVRNGSPWQGWMKTLALSHRAPTVRLVQEITTSFRIWTRPFRRKSRAMIHRHRVRLKFLSELLGRLQGRPLTTMGHSYPRWLTKVRHLCCQSRQYDDCSKREERLLYACRKCGYRIADSRDILILDKK